MSEHTPGPWTVTRHRDGSGGYLITDSKVVIRATTYGCNTHEEENANAHIIAAAPELLEALESLVDQVALHLSAFRVGPLDTNIEAAKAVIAKARGGRQ
ncbi:MAG: hypothetical protein HQL84_17060 [Magnetococcales bacterium]|nr:hypothetical protein [Magnetococcales bacterium]